MIRKVLLRLLGITVGIAGVAILLVGIAGEVLTRPATRAVGFPPADVSAIVVRIPTLPPEYVTGWFIRGVPRAGAVLLLHAVRSDRRQMLDRARFLRAAGYSVLLIDLAAHGESPGQRITFGAHESLGVNAALAFLRQQLPGTRVGVIGVSLGAASLVLARPNPVPDAVVLESMYPTIGEAVADRLAIRLGDAGRALAPLLLWQVPLRLGVSAADLRPIVLLPHLGAPLLIAAGTEDRHTRWSETEQLYAVAAQPKELWPVQGAAHVDLHHYDPVAYEAHILPFLAKYLRDN